MKMRTTEEAPYSEDEEDEDKEDSPKFFEPDGK